MNLNLNSYTPSEEMSAEDKFHYVHARMLLDQKSLTYDQFSKIVKNMINKAPGYIKSIPNFKQLTKNFYKIADLAYEDFKREQEDSNSWHKVKP